MCQHDLYVVGRWWHVVVSLPDPGSTLMNALSTAALAMAMSTDAFAAAIGKGTALKQPRWTEALRTGAIFGVIEGITPLVGWLLGLTAVNAVKEWDHWIAFVLLGTLGLHMVYNGLKTDQSEVDAVEDKPSRHSFARLALTGFATSIDAMAVGVGLAFIDVNIAYVAAAIGFATFVMVTLGVMLGRVMGAVVGKRAEIVGGIVLAAVGAAILFEHLTAA